MHKILDHLYLFSAIFFAVYSQCIIRWQLQVQNNIPNGLLEKFKFIVLFLFEPWVLSSVCATFLAGVCWIIALSKFELNYAYPWMALIFVIMMLMGVYLFDESLSPKKIIGTLIVVIGIIIIATG